ncbi:DmsC/YnfH family molybdoenzyme membrane anchor subunit [Adlercreutzia sp. R25]|uniref:dimethyl sulfoxide reductase anchor subunit family protein n=1 Tax=Adlercreutzia shanghongiae TaxID=3111773 RepID=UPI002DBFBF1F|nr:DmsC/YnfH family molybdoenzyme membrane anchor subunit [Adlercreutzia sp. R25]MEC4273031.1 DmsC/YnfH family molybdoenzyme membrane anchor subunit [Adlercreutzia sp. R25]
MEIQIPLVIFTSFLAWAAGIFGTQCVLALQKRGGAAQLPALIASVVILAVGGIAVVFHLTHPFNLFNGFGHLTSGITQELIAIVLLAVVMVLYFLMLRRSEDHTVPQWLAVVGIVLVFVLIFAMGHSYMMPSLPAWDTVLQMLSLLGAACVMGPATVAFIGALADEKIEGIGLLAVIGAAVNAVLSAAYMFAMEASSASFQSFQYYFDPTHPNAALANPADVSLFTGDSMTALVVAVIALIVALAGAFVGKKQDSWKVWGAVVAIAGLVCAVALRIMMYTMGETLFMLY